MCLFDIDFPDFDEELFNDGESVESFENDSDDPNDYYASRQAKLLTEQCIDDFDECFRRCEGLTFVFYGWCSGQANTVWPDVLTAIALISAAVEGREYEPPYPDWESWSFNRNTIPMCQVPSIIDARV